MVFYEIAKSDFSVRHAALFMVFANFVQEFSFFSL